MLGSQLAMGGGGTTRTWDGGAGDDNWNNNVNWSNNTLPSGNNDTASFAGNFGTGTTAITLGGNQNTGTLSISTTTDFSISNNTLTLATGDITRTATSGTTTINSGILLGGDGAWNIAGSAANGTLTVNGVIDDGASTFALVKSGTGRLVLNNANTFGGTMDLTDGVLVLGNDSAAGLGTLDLGGGTIEATGGTRTIANNLVIANNITFDGDNLIFTDSFDQGGGRTYIVNNTTEFSGSLSGSDNLTKSGTGTLILSGDNSLGNSIDTVTVSAGALRVANDGALGGTNLGTVINDGGALELIGGRTIGAEALTLRGIGVGGGGALRNISGNNSWAGNITLTDNTQVHRINSDAGLLTISGGISEAGNANNKDLTFGGAGDTAVSGVITSTAGGTDMRVFKDGAGNLNLTNANTYDGLTTISGGTLFANNATGSATGTGAVSVTAGTLGGSGTIAPTGTNGISVSGVLAPGGALNTIGTLTLNMGGTTGTVAMNSGASFEFQLGLPGGSIGSVGASDLLSLASASASDFAFNGNNVNFLSSGAVGFYKLFDTSTDNANTWTGLTFDSTTGVVSAGLTYSNLASGLSGAFLVGTAGNGGTTGDIYFQVVPEPRAALLGGLGVLLLLRRRRKG